MTTIWHVLAAWDPIIVTWNILHELFFWKRWNSDSPLDFLWYHWWLVFFVLRTGLRLSWEECEECWWSRDWCQQSEKYDLNDDQQSFVLLYSSGFLSKNSSNVSGIVSIIRSSILVKSLLPFSCMSRRNLGKLVTCEQEFLYLWNTEVNRVLSYLIKLKMLKASSDWWSQHIPCKSEGRRWGASYDTGLRSVKIITNMHFTSHSLHPSLNYGESWELREYLLANYNFCTVLLLCLNFDIFLLLNSFTKPKAFN